LSMPLGIAPAWVHHDTTDHATGTLRSALDQEIRSASAAASSASTLAAEAMAERAEAQASVAHLEAQVEELKADCDSHRLGRAATRQELAAARREAAAATAECRELTSEFQGAAADADQQRALRPRKLRAQLTVLLAGRRRELWTARAHAVMLSWRAEVGRQRVPTRKALEDRERHVEVAGQSLVERETRCDQMRAYAFALRTRCEELQKRMEQWQIELEQREDLLVSREEQLEQRENSLLSHEEQAEAPDTKAAQLDGADGPGDEELLLQLQVAREQVSRRRLTTISSELAHHRLQAERLAQAGGEPSPSSATLRAELDARDEALRDCRHQLDGAIRTAKRSQAQTRWLKAECAVASQLKETAHGGQLEAKDQLLADVHTRQEELVQAEYQLEVAAQKQATIARWQKGATEVRSAAQEATLAEVDQQRAALEAKVQESAAELEAFQLRLQEAEQLAQRRQVQARFTGGAASVAQSLAARRVEATQQQLIEEHDAALRVQEEAWQEELAAQRLDFATEYAAVEGRAERLSEEAVVHRAHAEATVEARDGHWEVQRDMLLQRLAEIQRERDQLRERLLSAEGAKQELATQLAAWTGVNGLCNPDACEDQQAEGTDELTGAFAGLAGPAPDLAAPAQQGAAPAKDSGAGVVDAEVYTPRGSAEGSALNARGAAADAREPTPAAKRLSEAPVRTLGAASADCGGARGEASREGSPNRRALLRRSRFAVLAVEAMGSGREGLRTALLRWFHVAEAHSTLRSVRKRWAAATEAVAGVVTLCTVFRAWGSCVGDFRDEVLQLREELSKALAMQSRFEGVLTEVKALKKAQAEAAELADSLAGAEHREAQWQAAAGELEGEVAEERARAEACMLQSEQAAAEVQETRAAYHRLVFTLAEKPLRDALPRHAGDRGSSRGWSPADPETPAIRETERYTIATPTVTGISAVSSVRSTDTTKDKTARWLNGYSQLMEGAVNK